MKKRKVQSYLLEGVFVSKTSKMGRGVFTDRPIEAGTIIELAPVIVMEAEHRLLLDQTPLHNYIFEWGKKAEQCIIALGLVSIYNHAFQSNCDYDMYFDKDSIAVKAVREIAAGEELFINYNGSWDNDKKVWFEAK